MLPDTNDLLADLLRQWAAERGYVFCEIPKTFIVKQEGMLGHGFCSRQFDVKALEPSAKYVMKCGAHAMFDAAEYQNQKKLELELEREREKLDWKGRRMNRR